MSSPSKHFEFIARQRIRPRLRITVEDSDSGDFWSVDATFSGNVAEGFELGEPFEISHDKICAYDGTATFELILPESWDPSVGDTFTPSVMYISSYTHDRTFKIWGGWRIWIDGFGVILS